jgi:hypothetical protein
MLLVENILCFKTNAGIVISSQVVLRGLAGGTSTSLYFANKSEAVTSMYSLCCITYHIWTT